MMLTPEMTSFDALRKNYHDEARITRTFLERLPDDRLDWQPHPKSMTLRSLAVHLAEIPGWPTMVLNTEGIDFAASSYTATPVAGKADLLALFDQNLAVGEQQLAQARPDELSKAWPMRMGEQVLVAKSKLANLQDVVHQTIHHRAQLGVYFRLLDVPVPATYGPSADDNTGW
ncbi:MAG TPA: DinB family protein [Hymenobacter sp.]|jgi:uncharacterized damage-inducible protein DinB